ncbi:sulfotransferase [Planosporangium sp. 12N6]|uniref:sulfotransferase n=1 Tax=Planosporangium spinosum TaxID=3402278 RepID=UPI003CEF47D1
MQLVRVLFLGGLGRSGTTLLERILGGLPGVCGLGEVIHLWERDLRQGDRCGCGTPFADCDFWRCVGQEAFGGWHRVDVDRVLTLRRAVERLRHIPRLAAGSVNSNLVEYATYYSRLYDAAAAVSGARVLVDSSKHPGLAFCLRQAAGVDLRVVHVVRDSRGVAHSWAAPTGGPQIDGTATPEVGGTANPEVGGTATPEVGRTVVSPGRTPGRSALLWNAHNYAFELLGRCGVPVRRLRYEQLLADPRGCVRALAAYAGLEADALDLSYLRREPDGTDHVDLRPGHSAAGSPMRFTAGTIALRRDDAWRQALRPRQRRLIGALTAPLMGAYGYPLRSGA